MSPWGLRHCVERGQGTEVNTGRGERGPHLWFQGEGPQAGGLRRWGRAGGCPALAQTRVDGVVGLVPLRSCHGMFRKEESGLENVFFFPRQGLQPQPGCCRNHWRWFRP